MVFWMLPSAARWPCGASRLWPRSARRIGAAACRFWSAGPGSIFAPSNAGWRLCRRSQRRSALKPLNCTSRSAGPRFASGWPRSTRMPRAGDRQRLLRAWEVVQATVRPLAEWQRRGGPNRAPFRIAIILIMPPRGILYAACDCRFEAMIAAGALEEARALMARHLPPDLPAMKGVGVPELMRHLRGEIGLDEAVALAQRATRRYAKRQMTWFRHQIVGSVVFEQQFSPSMFAQANDFIGQF